MPYFKFLPNEVKFFDLFDKQVDKMAEAVTCSTNLLKMGYLMIVVLSECV